MMDHNSYMRLKSKINFLREKKKLMYQNHTLSTCFISEINPNISIIKIILNEIESCKKFIGIPLIFRNKQINNKTYFELISMTTGMLLNRKQSNLPADLKNEDFTFGILWLDEDNEFNPETCQPCILNKELLS